MINIYQLEQFIEKQKDELQKYLKDSGLHFSQSQFIPKWQEIMSKPEYYEVNEMTKLTLIIEFQK